MGYKQLRMKEGHTTPIDSPFYKPLPAHYQNVKFQLLFFCADPREVVSFLPEPLLPCEDGLCVAGGIDVPYCSNYGTFQESFLQEKCMFQGEEGWYCSHVFHNGPIGIAAGREIYGTPKVFAQISVEQDEKDGVTITQTALTGFPIMRIVTTMRQEALPEELPSLVPSWRLKLIPRADAPSPAIKQLIDASPATTDIKRHCLLKGHGSLSFQSSPVCDLTPLSPRQYLDAFYMVMSYSESYARIVYDYLASGGKEEK